MTTQINAQDLKKHQWKQRVLVIMTNTFHNTDFTSQIEALEPHQDGIEERQLIVYQLHPEFYTIGFSENGERIKNAALYESLNKKDLPFEIVLIGLDGGIKLRLATLLSPEALFNTIDAMPMRRNELRRKD